MLNKPRFKRCFNVEILEPDCVFLVSEKDSFLLKGRLYELLTPLLDGEHNVDEIVEEVIPYLLPEKASAQDFISAGAHVYHALMQMEQKGYIIESDNNILPYTLTAFCESLNVDPKYAYEQLQKTKVSVQTFGAVSKSEFIATLESLHIQVSESGDIEVVLSDDYLQEGLDICNQKNLQAKRPWMLVKPVGTIVWIGPIFGSPKAGCWDCLAQRLRWNRPVEEFIQKYKGISTYPPSSTLLPSTLQTALGIAATELFKWIVWGENKRLNGIIMTYDTLSLQTRNHILVRRPQCFSCGEFRLNQEPLPIILGSRKKTFVADGGHRSCLPEETLKKYQHLISPITGITTEIEKVFTGSDILNNTYVAKHFSSTINYSSIINNITKLDNFPASRQNVKGISAGKGKTELQGKVSALCEAIERYCGVFQGDEIRQKASYKQMGDKAIHPHILMNFSPEQYKKRQQWNGICASISQTIPEPFDEEQEIEWTPVWSLTESEFKYVPTAYCYFGYPQLVKANCWADSNGCAAGNTIEEAILQGFMELVERDSVALWWYNRLKRPKVDLDSFDEPYFQAIKNYYSSLNRDLWVLDITNDLHIPSFVAITRRTDREVEDIVLGYGAHFDAKIAILRAITEANQIIPAVLLANADGSTQYSLSSDKLALDWWKNATVKNQSYLVPDESLTPKVCDDYSYIYNDDLYQDVMACKQIVEKNNMEILVLEQTRPDIGLKVVKVIVPGMRHFWRRLGSGRLYEVPVKLGWLEKPLQENQLNPFSMWM
ncbi:MAG: TOMM precursor leader peptide-binding protein [Nostocaceae cyanobacterium]|nr:TOMM precursor leader peptide-binding protein [Nostocaceae cyanobacterium]